MHRGDLSPIKPSTSGARKPSMFQGRLMDESHIVTVQYSTDKYLPFLSFRGTISGLAYLEWQE